MAAVFVISNSIVKNAELSDSCKICRSSAARYRYVLAAVISLTLLLSMPLPVFAADWVLARVSGSVYVVAPGVKATRAQKGMVLNPGYTIATKSGSRAMLTRGRETIQVGPKTTFALSKYRSNAGWTPNT